MTPDATHKTPQPVNATKMANLAWERLNPDKVSIPQFDAESAAWRSGYVAALDDMGFTDA